MYRLTPGNIALPGSGPCVFTPERVTGHPSVFPIELPEEDEDEEKTGQNAFMLMIDLMVDNKKVAYISRKKSPLKNNYAMG